MMNSDAVQQASRDIETAAEIGQTARRVLSELRHVGGGPQRQLVRSAAIGMFGSVIFVGALWFGVLGPPLENSPWASVLMLALASGVMLTLAGLFTLMFHSLRLWAWSSLANAQWSVDELDLELELQTAKRVAGEAADLESMSKSDISTLLQRTRRQLDATAAFIERFSTTNALEHRRRSNIASLAESGNTAEHRH